MNCSIVQHPESLSQPVSPDFDHSLEKRHPYKYQEKPAFWFDYKTGWIVLPDGRESQLAENIPLTILLDKIASHAERKHNKKVAVLYLVAGRAVTNRPKREWFSSVEWQQVKMFWNRLQVEYERNGFTIHLHSTANFFGEETDIHAMRDALQDLEQGLERKFNAEGYRLIGDTPGQTGRELLAVSLPKDWKYPRLPNDLLELINRNFGQSRIETFSPKKAVLGNGVYVIDGRWMYASCVSHLPVGPCYHDNRNEFLGVTTKAGNLYPACPGLYSCTITVSAEWNHIGLIKSGRSQVLIDESGYYPNVPGEVFTNWTTSNELAIALGHGWQVQINERIIWPDTEKITDPLANWRRKLVNFREDIEEELVKEYSKVGALQKDAIRSIVLHTIGSFHRFADVEEHFTPRSELPIDEPVYRGKFRMTREGMYWLKAIPFTSVNRQKFVRPEWSAIAWGRARARLASFALRLPYEDIVSLRTDSVWCASLPGWLAGEDTGKPGCFRLKEHIQDAFTWPASGAKMRAYVVAHNLQDETEETEG